MQRSRKLGIVLVLVMIAMPTIGASAFSSAAAVGGHRAGGRVIYRGRSAPLRRLAGRVRTVAPIRRPSLLPGGFNGRVQANLAHIDQVNALEDGEGGER
jgi:hypothetical protein